MSSDVWSEGLGWYALILVETLTLLDSRHPGRQGVSEILQGLVEALARFQDPDTGLWYQVVDKGARPDNWHDTSGSAMFVCAIQRALELGFVDALRFGPAADKGFAGILTRATAGTDGLVDVHDACDGVGVQNGCSDYVNHPRVVNAKEAVGSVLWASVIMEKPGPR